MNVIFKSITEWDANIGYVIVFQKRLVEGSNLKYVTVFPNRIFLVTIDSYRTVLTFPKLCEKCGYLGDMRIDIVKDRIVETCPECGAKYEAKKLE